MARVTFTFEDQADGSLKYEVINDREPTRHDRAVILKDKDGRMQVKVASPAELLMMQLIDEMASRGLIGKGKT